MNPFQKMVLIGCGLIGGSLAIALRQAGQVIHIIGIDRESSHLRDAMALGIIDETADHLGSAVAGADLIVLATPVRQAVGLLKELSALPLEPHCLVTDVCGTKREVHEAARALPDHVYFIGGHPMAGSEKAGIRAANARMFENAVYVISPAEDVPGDIVGRFRSAIESIHAKVLELPVDVHDQVVGAISHLPHLIAAQLVIQVADLSRESDLYHMLAAGGFRDITRIASSNPVMWRDVVLSNKEVLVSLMEDWNRRNQALAEWIRRGDAAAIERFFSKSRDWRDALPVRGKGAIRPVYQITVSVPDEPGMIGKVASLLGQEDISIRNIGILESREGDNGQLILTFDRDTEMEEAIRVLAEAGYPVYRRDD
jgi:prephenate dehydrogenase